MIYRPQDLKRIARQIVADIEGQLSKSGIFYRIFYRCKSPTSLEKKLATQHRDGTPKYVSGVKELRDIIGIRLNLYFIDDLELVTSHLKKHFRSSFVEETIDFNSTTEFKPQRINIVFKIPEHFEAEFRQVIPDNRVGATFELQLRTIFSEGWHEVEHDFRYKCRSDWSAYSDMSRIFNGFLATLETQEWSIVHFFDRFSYRQYKADNVSASIRTKLRIRFEGIVLSPQLLAAFEINEDFTRFFFKLEREKIIVFLLNLPELIPLTLENVIYLINYQFIRDSTIENCAPAGVVDVLNVMRNAETPRAIL
jgi:ppGpp synthetase/RelA/SpoT-type nucleotidyltranferase